MVLSYTDDISLNGYHWGIGASLGGTIKLKPITLEPFVNFSYQQTKLDGDGDRKNSAGTTTNLWDMDKSRNEWSIGGGFSVLFDLLNSINIDVLRAGASPPFFIAPYAHQTLKLIGLSVD